MKRINSIILILIYLVTINGVSLSIHECQGKTSFIFSGVAFNKTCKCSHTDIRFESKCCSNKKIVVEKNNSDNFSPKGSIEVKKNTSKSGDFGYSTCQINYPHQGFILASYNIKSPPLILSTPRYLSNRVLLI